MRPQIRSLPLSKIECPQFTWAVRNNSENVSVALQPDLHQCQTNCDDKTGVYDQTSQNPCYCIEKRLKPTLFPHPVTCVCSDEPCPPKNEKYRYCKLKMDQSIGDVMEGLIMDSIPPPTPPDPLPRERMMRKIIRSAYIPEEIDLTNENACVECLAKDPTLLRELLDSIKYKKAEEEKKSDRKSCVEPGECCKKPEDGFDCFKEDSPKEPKQEDEKTCKWKKGAVCTCKQQRQEVCGDCDDCSCKCRKSCLKCTCKSSSAKKSVAIEAKNSARSKEDEVKTKKSARKVSKEPVEIDEEPLLPSPNEKKTGKKPKKTKVKSPKKAKSPKKSKWKRPDNIICERFELVETHPYYNQEEDYDDQSDNPSPVQIYEHFRSVKTVRSGSSKSTSEAAGLPQAKSSTTQKSSTSGSKKTKQKTPAKLPWNWNNQPKHEDPLKKWKGTKYSWSKRFDYAKLDKKLDEENEKMLRSRGGDDVLGRAEEEGPRYYEYKPNLRERNFDLVGDNEEVIKSKEQRKFRLGYGRMRVKSWHQTLMDEASEPPEKPKEKSEFSDDEIEETTQESPKEDDHDRKHCLQCLMSDVQQRFLGSSNNLCPHKVPDENTNDHQVPQGEDAPNEALQRLPTIVEENQAKSEASAETYRVDDAKTRPKTADGHLGDFHEEPFFNVIKQRIHQRNKTLEDLDKLRNDVLSKETPQEDHTCVHRFTVDDRLFPKPLHCDRSGVSCCVHCDKPMTESEKSVFLDQRDSKEKVVEEEGVRRQVSKFSLRPKPVHIGARNSVMEIRLRQEHRDLLPNGYVAGRGVKKVFYPDSLALRHQRR